MNVLTCYKIFTFIFLSVIFLNGCSKKVTNNYNRKEVIFLEINSDLSVASEYEIHFQNGVKLALKELNSIGGVNGKKIVTFHRNDFLSYVEAKRAVIDYKNSNVLAVFGTFFPLSTSGVVSGANQAHIPFLSTGYSDENIFNTSNDNYAYSLRPSLYQSLKALAIEASKSNNLNRWLIFTYSNQEGYNASNFFKKELVSLLSKKENGSKKDSSNKDLGYMFKDLYISPFKAHNFLITSNLDKILSNTKAVLIITNGKDLQNLIDKTKLKEKLSNKIVFAPFAGDPEWLEYTNEFTTPEHWTVTGYPWYQLNKNSLHKEFYNKYYSTYKLQPRYSALLGYISMYMLAETAKKINLNNTNIEEVRKEFKEKLSTIVLKETPLGTIYMYPNHISSMGLYVGVLNNYSQKIIGHTGESMLLKDIRMIDITYYGKKNSN